MKMKPSRQTFWPVKACYVLPKGWPNAPLLHLRIRRWQIYRAQALPRLKRAVEFDDSNVAAFILLAKFEAMDPRAKADALKNIEKAIELSADDRIQLSNALVIRARLKTDKEAVLSDLNQAIKHNADNIQAHELRAWTLLSDKKVK